MLFKIHRLQVDFRMVLALLTLVLASRTLPVGGAESSEEFRLFSERVEMPEQGFIYGSVVLIGKRRFSFLPPFDWVQESNAKEKLITFTRRDLKGAMTLRITQSNINSNLLRQHVLTEFPDAKITAEFTCYTSALAGRAFEFERISAKNFKLVSRVAYVPFNGGMIEFQMTSTPELFRSCHPLFGRLLTSFKVDEPSPPTTPLTKKSQ